MIRTVDIYFDNAPKDIDGGFHELRITEVRKSDRRIILNDHWNYYDVRVGRSEYRTLKAYCRFLGWRPSRYADGSVSTYIFRMDYQHWPLLWALISTGIAQ
jgi:hypothetical protein